MVPTISLGVVVCDLMNLNLSMLREYCFSTFSLCLIPTYIHNHFKSKVLSNQCEYMLEKLLRYILKKMI